jgi:hypothetical protein
VRLSLRLKLSPLMLTMRPFANAPYLSSRNAKNVGVRASGAPAFGGPSARFVCPSVAHDGRN